MRKLVAYLCAPVSSTTLELMIASMRVGIGILTIGHGLPKIMGGMPLWHTLGQMTASIGITWLPTLWGFLGACTEACGGLAFVLGCGTRLASIALTFMMIVATAWHVSRHDIFNVYSFPLSLIIIFGCFIIIGGGKFSVDAWLCKRG